MDGGGVSPIMKNSIIFSKEDFSTKLFPRMSQWMLTTPTPGASPSLATCRWSSRRGPGLGSFSRSSLTSPQSRLGWTPRSPPGTPPPGHRGGRQGTQRCHHQLSQGAARSPGRPAPRWRPRTEESKLRRLLNIPPAPQSCPDNIPPPNPYHSGIYYFCKIFILCFYVDVTIVINFNIN